VTDYEGLKALAKASTGGGTANRGACKVCGGLGHLTKQCRNLAATAAAAEGRDESLAARGGLALLTEADDADGLELLASDSDSDSDTGSDGGRRGSTKRKRSSKSEKESKRGSKKEKRKKHKKDKSSKRSRRERSRSP